MSFFSDFDTLLLDVGFVSAVFTTYFDRIPKIRVLL